jgi:hypothetical protein
LAKICTYCGSEIGFARSFKGELFCSSEHNDLYLQEQARKGFDRMMNLSEPLPSKASPSKQGAAPQALASQETDDLAKGL